MARKTYKSTAQLKEQFRRLSDEIKDRLHAAGFSGWMYEYGRNGERLTKEQRNLLRRQDRLRQANRNMFVRYTAQGKGFDFYVPKNDVRILTNNDVPTEYDRMAGILTRNPGDEEYREKIREEYGDEWATDARIRATFRYNLGMANG